MLTVPPDVPGLVGQINDFKEIPPSSGITPGDTSLQYHHGFYFISDNPSNPQVGHVCVCACLCVFARVRVFADVISRI